MIVKNLLCVKYSSFVSKRLAQANVDQFLCCGPTYQDVKKAVAQVLLENKSDALVRQIQVRFTSLFNIYKHLITDHTLIC